MGIRRPWVAGAFYPADPERLNRTIKDSFTHRLGPGEPPRQRSSERKIVSVVCPHAGYMYSGPTAAHSYHQLASEAEPDSVVILGPNHTGLGGPVSLWGTGAWETPLGHLRVDEELAMDIFETSDFIDMDETAHLREHSIEVQLPFLQYVYQDIRFVPICMGLQDLETSREVGRAIVEAIRGKDILILASTDLTHMESKASASAKDHGVIESIEAMDEAALQNWVRTQRVSMCGYGPVSAAIYASKMLGAEKAELLSYSTSGDITGDLSAVVGYAAVKITR
ncbi:MAG: AmmeMemoRadiSam system protein B [Candidatus Bathyarchaeota archaeon]|nr:MAG: AmmeMemoRadiSam system protein B [Candidatus Bathyarchaeota archaeon]